jgi:hypothetical protein
MGKQKSPFRHYSRHHVWYERPRFENDGIYHRLRSHAGFIILTHNLDHNNGPGSLHCDRRLRQGVPRPGREATEAFLKGVLLPYQEDQSRAQSLDQAIGWFACTGDQATAEHLALQREYIMRTPVPGEAEGYGRAA